MRRSDDAEYLISSALERIAAGDPRRAIAAIHAAAVVEPDWPMTAIRMAEIELQTQGAASAWRWLRRLEALAPASGAAAVILGQILLVEARNAAAADRRVEATRRLHGALALSPDSDAALLELGLVAERPLAIASLRRSLAIRCWAGPCINLGNLAKSINRSTEAVRWYRCALALDPSQAYAWNNLATTKRDGADLPAALAFYRRAVTVDTAASATESNLLQALQFDPEIGDVALAMTHRGWADRHARRFVPSSPCFANVPEPERQLAVGYVSPDLGRHPVGFFLLPVLAAHDRRSVRTVCYATRTMDDEVAQALRAASDVWVDAAGLDDDMLAARIRADRIDVLVDLSGHTAHHRLLLFARRPAPVQATWLGYFDTTGLDTIDLLLTDGWEVPPGEDARFAEQVIRMPSGRFAYRPPAYAPPPAVPPSLTAGCVTFGCFNNLGKITEPVVRSWSRILTQVPRARLILKWASLADDAVRSSMLQRFRAYGVDPERLILRGASFHEGMLAEYGDVDVALDPFPFSGCLTTVEALWMGVPVITLAGRRPVARQSAAILWRLGLDALVATDEDSYVGLATAISADEQGRVKLRAELRRRMSTSTLLDGRSVAADVERAFREAWHRWCRPAH